MHKLITIRHAAVRSYGAPFVKISYLTDLAQKLLSLAEIAISACRGGELRLFLHLQVQKENALTERAR